MPNEVLETLQHTKLFKHLSEEKLQKLFTQTTVETYPADALIVKEGEIGEKVYIIIEGAVRVFTHNQKGEEIVLIRLEKDEFFGEQSLLTAKPTRRNASIKAVTDVKLAVISHTAFHQTIQANTELLQLLKEQGKTQLVQKLELQLQERGGEESELLSLFNHAEHFAEQHVFFHQGDTPQDAYYILNGVVEVRFYDDDQSLEFRSQVHPGQFFGELGILENMPRAGTAVAISEVDVFTIKADALRQAYEKNPHLQALMNAMIRIYKVPSFGTMTQYQGNFLGQPAIQTTIQKNNHETIVASRVINTNIFAISYSNTDKASSVFFEDTPDHIREIRLINNHLVGVVSIGRWDDLDEVCRLIHDKPAVTPDILLEFSKTGKISSKTSIPSSEQGNLCECMQVKYQAIQACVKKGITTLEGIAKKTGAGTICGGCRPRITELLGGEVWTYVKIINIVQHNDHVRSYQLQPLHRKVSSYFAGQHIVVEANIDGNWIARTYTLTSPDSEKNYYEITVKREPKGLFSRWLFDHGKINMVLRLAEPEGSFILYPEKMKPAICFMGGIGITPAIAFARKLISDHMQRPLHIDYSVAKINDISFRDEIQGWPQQHPTVSTHIRVTSEHGHVTENEVREISTIHPHADYFICGPKTFEATLTQMLKNVGIAEDRIHLEFFTHAGGPKNLDDEDLT